MGQVFEIGDDAAIEYITWAKRIPRKLKKAIKKAGPPILICKGDIIFDKV